ncbi:hypothetical protein F8203_gp030 [Heliothis virescens ascovirus 3f]|uniref:Uncharacterized protein n=1 Tax=Heliothis virescens ascovirus 3f TaxID=328614 RepID=A0A171PVB9_9VIRU|nr:hypothetical protein F8203_gp030 [Heliothis virescens ascovirus 3f]AJP08996.1 hypothetical protein [Heliothis virescens ascovirus 3f]
MTTADPMLDRLKRIKDRISGSGGVCNSSVVMVKRSGSGGVKISPIFDGSVAILHDLSSGLVAAAISKNHGTSVSIVGDDHKVFNDINVVKGLRAALNA